MHYGFFGESVRGASHIKNGAPCQDALLIKACGNMVIAAVADGHGSENCPYSDQGAKAAVEAVWEVFENILSQAGPEQVFTTLSANKEIWLPRQIENIWKENIKKLHSEKEQELLEQATPEQAMSKQEQPFSEDNYVLYGTTVLGVVAAEEFIFALQIGDGDILSIDGGESRWMITPDYIAGSETYSLCLKNSWEYIKTAILPLDAEGTRKPPEMIMLCTDGYANSFASEEGFLKAGTDINRLLNEEGEEYIQSQLATWLEDSSYNGSGDDITLALIFSKQFFNN